MTAVPQTDDRSPEAGHEDAGCREAGYRHEALLCSGTDGFLEATVPFITDAVATGEPILVVVTTAKIDLLRSALDADAEAVLFSDMAEVGQNPARIVSAWQAFLPEHARSGTQVRGIGEPVYPGRSPAELSECYLHEVVLNVAFDSSTPFWLRCPYDLDHFGDDVIGDAHRSHPYIVQSPAGPAVSDRYQALDPSAPFDRPLPPAPPAAAELVFSCEDLRRVRGFVAEHGLRAGLDQDRTQQLVLAIDELAANSVQHGGGSGTLRSWIDGDVAFFEVVDDGQITAPLVGRFLPPPESPRGRGLWIANQLCDLVQIQSSTRGTLVRVHARV